MNVDLGQLQPGVFGVSHGSGIGGELIRHATEAWAGHAFVYVGDGRLVEGTPPVARIAPVTEYDDAVWAWKMWDAVPGVTTGGEGTQYAPRAELQAKVIARAHAMVGTPYDWPAYIGFALEILKLRTGAELNPVFKADRWRVCSALVADCYEYAGFPLDFTGAPYAGDANLVSPAMLYDLAARKGWT